MRQGSNPRRSRGRGPRKPHNPLHVPRGFDGGGGRHAGAGKRLSGHGEVSGPGARRERGRRSNRHGELSPACRALLPGAERQRRRPIGPASAHAATAATAPDGQDGPEQRRRRMARTGTSRPDGHGSQSDAMAPNAVRNGRDHGTDAPSFPKIASTIRSLASRVNSPLAARRPWSPATPICRVVD